MSSPFGSSARDNAKKIFNSMSVAAQNKFGTPSAINDGKGGAYDGQGGPEDDIFGGFLNAGSPSSGVGSSPVFNSPPPTAAPIGPPPPNATHVIVRNPQPPTKPVNPPPVNVQPPQDLFSIPKNFSPSTGAPTSPQFSGVGNQSGQFDQWAGAEPGAKEAVNASWAVTPPTPGSESNDPWGYIKQSLTNYFHQGVLNQAQPDPKMDRPIYTPEFLAKANSYDPGGASLGNTITTMMTGRNTAKPYIPLVAGPNDVKWVDENGNDVTARHFPQTAQPPQVPPASSSPVQAPSSPGAGTQPGAKTVDAIAKSQNNSSNDLKNPVVTSTVGSVEDPSNAKNPVPILAQPTVPLSITPGIALDKQFPDGSYGGQCISFLHQLAQFPNTGDTLAEKEATVQKNGILAKDWTPQVGDVVISSANKVNGHGFMINKLLPNGYAQVTESNYHGDGTVTNTRIVNLNDPSIYGAIRPTSFAQGITTPQDNSSQLSANTPQDLSSRYAMINSIVADARAQNIGPDAFVSEVMQNPTLMARIFGGVPADYTGSANLSKINSDHADMLRKKYGLDEMAAKIAALPTPQAMAKQLDDFVTSKDEFIKTINPLIEKTQEQLVDPNVITNGTMFIQAQNYLNYLTTIKGGQEKRYADLVQQNVDMYTAQSNTLTNQYTLLKDAYTKQVTNDSAILGEDFNNKKTALQGMYSNLDQQALTNASIEKAQSDAWISHYNAAVTALQGTGVTSGAFGAGYDVKDEPYAQKVLSNIGQTPVEIPATGDTPKQTKYFTNLSDSNTLANLINQGEQTYVTESTTGKQRAMSGTAVLFALTHEMANNASPSIIGASPTDKNETYVNTYQPAIIKYLAENGITNGTVNQAVATNGLALATTYINSLKKAMNDSLKADPTQVTNVQNAAKALLLVHHTFSADQAVDPKTLMDPTYQAAWKSKFTSSVNPAVLEGILNYTRVSAQASTPADKIYTKFSDPTTLGDVLSDGMSLPLIGQLSSLGLNK